MSYGRPAEITEQTLFDKSATHLLTQMSRCTADLSQGRCLYRNKDTGAACAVGCLLTDEEASRGDSVPHSNAWDRAKHCILAEDLLSFSDLLRRLQVVHDGYKPRRWFGELQEVAVERGLSMEALESFRPR